MGKTKTKSRSVGDSPKPPITIRSTNPKILDDNIAKLENAIKASDVSANPSGTAEETLLSSIGIDGKKYELGPSAENTSYDNTDSGLTATNTQEAIDELSGIVSSGSNTNGSWIKFSDGTLICTKTITGEVTSASDWNAWGSLYSFLTSGGSWPETFYSAPAVSASNISNDAAYMIGYVKGITTTGLTNVLIVRPTAPDLLGFGISIIAVGRWKA